MTRTVADQMVEALAATRAQIATEVRARPLSARFADKPEDFAKLGIQLGRIGAEKTVCEPNQTL